MNDIAIPDSLRDSGLVWHYTTLETLQYILESGALLATEVSYQNDPREPDTGRDAVRAALEQLRSYPVYEVFSREALRWHKEWDDHFGFIGGRSGELVGRSRFIFCASSDPDNLYAWRTYAGAGRTGCVIGLDPAKPLGLLDERGSATSVELSQWSDVIYEPDELLRFSIGKLKAVGDAWNAERQHDMADVQAQEARGISNERLQNPDTAFVVLLKDFARATAEITAVGKHQSFRDEHETRITVSGTNSGIVFSPGVDGPRPRVRLVTSSRWGEVLKTAASPLPIRALILAPDARTNALTTAQWLLHANGYPLDPVFGIDESGPIPYLSADSTGTVDIYRSSHPYRNV
jgi:hypothetical protein